MKELISKELKNEIKCQLQSFVFNNIIKSFFMSNPNPLSRTKISIENTDIYGTTTGMSITHFANGSDHIKYY